LGQCLNGASEQIRGILGPSAANIEQPWQAHLLRVRLPARLEHQGPHQRGLAAPTLTHHKAVEALAQGGTNTTDLVDAIDEQLMVQTRVQQGSATQFHGAYITFSK
jgi:hypothetical protein